MKLRLIFSLILLINNVEVFSSTHFSETLKENNTKTKSNFLRKVTPEFLYSYIDFKFDSTTQSTYNRYKGHSNVFSVGGDHFNLGKDVFSGIYLFKINTILNSQFLLDASALANTHQDIDNNTLFAHVLKSFKAKFFLDLAGAYGQNKLTLTSTQGDKINNETAVGHTRNSNWFVTANAIYRTSWKKILFRANVGSMYIQTNSGTYQFLVPRSNVINTVLALTNKVTLIQENAELSYQVSSTWSPFINGGLIQVAHNYNSRALIANTVSGILPQIALNMNGYRAGAGVTINMKKMTLRLEEKYYNASGTFQSYQSIAALEYRFD